MADPVTLGVIITGLVGAYKAYTEYKAAVAKLREKQDTPPSKGEAAAKGEQVAPLIKAAVEQHGATKEQTTLQLFEDDPETYEEPLKKVLISLADHNPAFASHIQTLAQKADIQTGGIQGSINVSGQGKVYGPAAGVNTGTMSGTYSFGETDDQDKQNR